MQHGLFIHVQHRRVWLKACYHILRRRLSMVQEILGSCSAPAGSPRALPPFMTIRSLVPKFHLQSHVEACHSAFSFNFFRGGGRTDGEGVERNWDGLNGQAPSTSEMLPGGRWDTLDDCCGWANWRKTMGLGAYPLL